MGYEHAIFVFDRDVLNRVLALTWPEYMRKYRLDDGQRESLVDFLTEFALVEAPEDEALARRIIGSWTLRRTARHCGPQVFFIEEVLHCVRNGTPCSIWGSGPVGALDLFAELATLRNAVIPAFLDGRMTASAFRAVMKLAKHADAGYEGYEMTAAERGRVSRALRENAPKSAFAGLPPEAGLYSTLSASETQRFLRAIDDGFAQNWPAPSGTFAAQRKAKKSVAGSGAADAP